MGSSGLALITRKPPDDLVQDLVKFRDDIAWLQDRIHGRTLSADREIFLDYYEQDRAAYTDLSTEGWHHGSHFASVKYKLRQFVLKLQAVKDWLLFNLGFTEEDNLRRLEARLADLESRLAVYRDGQAQGVGVAFFIFKDVCTANNALKDIRTKQRRPVGMFVSIMELQLKKKSIGRLREHLQLLTYIGTIWEPANFQCRCAGWL